MRAAIYAKYLLGRDRDKTSTIEGQLAMCREKAASEGIAIDDNHMYNDSGISGGTIERDAFQQMLSNIEAGVFPETLYAKDEKRLSRNEREVRGWWSRFGNTR